MVQYARMTYVVRHGGQYSEAFKSNIGVLTGDSASPGLWNIFFADLCLPTGPDDITLDGIAVSHVEQADDVALFSTTREGVQRLVDAFFEWCRNNFTVISVLKTQWMLFGPLPRVLPGVYVGNTPIELVHEYKFVGVWFTSTTREIFSKHYSVKASKARSLSYATFSVESFVGVIPPREGLLLYKARVDPHLTSGCEVVLDTDPKLWSTLETPQTQFLRRLLGLNPRSMVAVLFTETGLMPIRYRRAALALRYALAFADIPPDVDDLPRAAFRESIRLARGGFSSWAGDLCGVLRSLHVSSAADLSVLTSKEGLSALLDDLGAACDSAIDAEIAAKVKTHFLKDRVDVGDDGKPTKATLRFRHYLRLLNAPHRIAFTRLLLSDHRLAVEGLRHGNRVWRFVERDLRLCRFCRGAVEDECHALLVCAGHPTLTALRGDFLRDVCEMLPHWRPRLRTATASEFLMGIIHCRDVTKRLARFVFDVFAVFDQAEMWIPPSHYIRAAP